MNFEQARHNMIEQQIRTWEVLDQRVLDLFDEIHREDFVPDAYRNLALADVQLPLLHEQVTMTPQVEARLVQSLDIRPDDRILEVGTGCAYLTSILARAGQHVTSIDIFEDFIRMATLKLSRHKITNVTLDTRDVYHDLPGKNTYDVIVLTGSLPIPDPRFQQQLEPGGRMFVITGTLPIMEAQLITRIGKNEWRTESLFETAIPPLIGATEPESFKL